MMTVGMKSNHKEFVMNGIKDESVYQLRHLYVSPLLLIFFPHHMINAYIRTIKRELFFGRCVALPVDVLIKRLCLIINTGSKKLISATSRPIFFVFFVGNYAYYKSSLFFSSQ